MEKTRYYAAGYLRLSDKDLHLDISEQSESIENQKNIILEYEKKNPDVKVVRFFIDDGYTGLNYKRDGYQQMMQWIDEGKINMIITKELSRLGREHADTIRLFKQDFVRKKIRYVAVIDNIDFNGRIEGIDIPFKVLVNDYYSQNLSNTVTKTLRNMQKQGKYVAAFTPYGYLKDPEDKHKLIIDPYASKIVKRIYAYYRLGYSIDWICRRLTEEKIPSPGQYKQSFTNFKCPTRLSRPDYWTYSSIWHILKSEIYIGTMVQHKREKIAYNLSDTQKVPENEVIKIPGLVEPIVEKEEWDQVQELMIKKRRTGLGDGSSNLFAGLIQCGDCKRSLGRVKDHHYPKRYYRCNTYARMGKEYCSPHKIQEKTLQDIVLQAIKKNAMESEVFQNMKLSKSNNCSIKNQNEQIIKKCKARLESLEHERAGMLKNLARGIITEDDFLLYKEQYEAEKKQLEYQLSDLQKEQNNTIIVDKEYQTWVNEFIVHRNLEILTREIVLHLIKSIVVYEGNKVEITFRFRNPFENI